MLNYNTAVVKSTVDESTGEVTTDQQWVSIKPPRENEYTLDNITGFEDMETWFLIYWLEKFRVQHEKTQHEIKKNNPGSVYFQEFNECIGSLVLGDNYENIKDFSVIPVSDPGDHGYTCAATLNYVIPQETRDLTETMSREVSDVFKRNARKLKDPLGIASYISSSSHGRSLVTDSMHYIRMSETAPKSCAVIKNKLGDMFRVLEFIQNNNSVMEFYRWTANINVESTPEVLVDSFSNKVNRYGKEAPNAKLVTNIEMLGARS